MIRLGWRETAPGLSKMEDREGRKAGLDPGLHVAEQGSARER